MVGATRVALFTCDEQASGGAGHPAFRPSSLRGVP